MVGLKKEAGRRILLAIIILAVLLLAVYLTFFYSKSCKDSSCFTQSLSKCQKASFINDAKAAAWHYSIKGIIREESEKNCRIDVKMLQVKEGETELEILQGKSMSCYLPKGVVASPESDLSKCHGLLKEYILEKIIVKKMHTYILEHIGEVSEELTKI